MKKSVMRRFAGFLIIAAMASLSPKPLAAEEAAKPAEESAKEKPAASAEAKDCLFYEPGVVVLKGQLHRAVSLWMLELRDPVCIDKREDDKMNFYPAADEVKNIFFWPRRGDLPDKYKEFLDKDVVVTGTLHHKNTGSNKGQIMMMVSHIETAKKD